MKYKSSSKLFMISIFILYFRTNCVNLKTTNNLKINMKIEKKGTIKNEITKTDNSEKTSNSAKTYAETSSNQIIVNTDLLQDDEKKLLKQ